MLALNNATMVIKEQSRDGNPTVVMMLPVLGNNRAPLYAVLSFYSNKKINGKFEKRPHIILTISPREFFEEDGSKGWSDIVSSAIEKNRVLDFKKERGSDLSVIAQHVKLGDITETSLRSSISQFRKEINTFKQKQNFLLSGT